MDRKYSCFIFFLLSVSKIRFWEKDLGTDGLFGRWSQEAQEGIRESETKNREKLTRSMSMSKLPCEQLGLSLAGDSLRNPMEHVSESSHWKTGSLWYLFIDLHLHWLKVSPSGVNYPTLQIASDWGRTSFHCAQKSLSRGERQATWGGRLLKCWKRQLQVKPGGSGDWSQVSTESGTLLETVWQTMRLQWTHEQRTWTGKLYTKNINA